MISPHWSGRLLLLAATFISLVACSRFDIGGSWVDEGGEVADPDALRLSPGTTDHCDWGSATFLSIGLQEPLAGVDAGWFDQYVRDPDGLFTDLLAATFDPDAAAPSDAVFTGYHTGSVRLWLAESVESVAFLELADGTFEAWPRVTGDVPILCA